MTRCTPGCILASGAYASSTTQSMFACAKRCRMSAMTGRLCTTSPSEEVLTMRIFFTAGAPAEVKSPAQGIDYKQPMPLSAVIITYNAAASLERCLRSARFADELLVVDSSSTDGTAQIAERLGARVVTTEQWHGFGPQKQLAIETAAHDWVLCLDADEEVSEELKQSILRALESPGARAFLLCRRNRFLGRWLSHGE